jgi:branched-chain amino acid transport system ATP-binding protein
LARLEAKGLQARYGRAQVLFGLDLQLDAGEALVLLGRNGAGKSTTLKVLMGLLAATAGEVRFDGRRIDGLQPFEIARLGLGYVPEDRRVFGDLSVLENLEAGRRPPRDGAPGWTLERLFEVFPALARASGRSAGRLSGGEQQMLSIARTLAGNPVMMLLDEPSEGLAPMIVEQLVAVVQKLRESGMAILLCEQNLAFARRIAGRACVIEKGSIARAGTLAELEADRALREEYLGP